MQAPVDRRKSSVKRLIVWVISLITAGGIGVYLWYSADQLLPLISVPIYQILIVGALYTVGILLNAGEFWLLYRRLGADIGIIENWLLYGAGQLLNHAPGQVGTIYRFEYLRSVHGLTLSRSASGYGANLLLTVMSTGLLGTGATILVGTGAGVWSPWLVTAFIGMTLTSAAAFFFDLPTPRGHGVVASSWREFRTGWAELLSHRRTALLILAIELSKYAFLAVRMKISLSWIGIDESYSLFLVLAAVTGVVSFVALTPASIGIRELAIGLSAASLGVQFDVALMGATLDRAVALVWVVLVGGAGLMYTGRRLAVSRASQVTP